MTISLRKIWPNPNPQLEKIKGKNKDLIKLSLFYNFQFECRVVRVPALFCGNEKPVVHNFYLF